MGRGWLLQSEPSHFPPGCSCVVLGRSLCLSEPLSSYLLMKMLTVPPCQELQTERWDSGTGGSALPQVSGLDLDGQLATVLPAGGSTTVVLSLAVHKEAPQALLCHLDAPGSRRQPQP